ncbi:MAG TPA: hypothetical protein VGM83_21790 [Devosiaceae bacterium]|jgi:hypothetical protein
MKVRFALMAAFAVVSLSSITAPASAQMARTTACQPSGPFAFPGLLRTSTDPIQGKIRKTISAVGIKAIHDHCGLNVVCVSFDNSKPSFEDAKLRCKVIRDILVQSKTGDDKSAAKAKVVLKTVRPEDGFAAGAINISLQ